MPEMCYEGRQSEHGKRVHAVWMLRDRTLMSRWLCGYWGKDWGKTVPADQPITCQRCLREVTNISESAIKGGYPNMVVRV
jgi:hypothetical protein